MDKPKLSPAEALTQLKEAGGNIVREGVYYRMIQDGGQSYPIADAGGCEWVPSGDLEDPVTADTTWIYN